MNHSSKQDIAKLVAYKDMPSEDAFVEKVVEKVGARRIFRKRILSLVSVSAALISLSLVGVSSSSNWQFISNFVSQSPMLLSGVVTVFLLSGTLLVSESK